MKTGYYTGVGARATPKDILKIMNDISLFLSKKGYVLRSGGANGADIAFESCSIRKNIYLPWRGFNNNKSDFYNIPERYYNIAEGFLDNWKYMKPSVKKLMARNVQQVIGHDEDIILSDFLICYTSNGETIGGTGFAIRLAEYYNVPILNLGKFSKDNIKKNINIFLKTYLYEK